MSPPGRSVLRRKLQRLLICVAWVGLGFGTALILSGCGDGTPTKEVEIVRPVRTFQVFWLQSNTDATEQMLGLARLIA